MTTPQRIFKHEDSALVLIDYQTEVFDNVRSETPADLIIDAVGGMSQLARRTAVDRLTQAGAAPNTAMAVVTELFRDWASPVANDARNILKAYATDLSALAAR